MKTKKRLRRLEREIQELRESVWNLRCDLSILIEEKQPENDAVKPPAKVNDHYSKLINSVVQNVPAVQLKEIAGDLVNAEDFSKLLAQRDVGPTPTYVDSLRESGFLLALWDGDEWLYPHWQQQDGEILHAVADLIECTPRWNDIDRIVFLRTPKERFYHMTPLALLQQGRKNVVLEHAKLLNKLSWLKSPVRITEKEKGIEDQKAGARA